MFLLNCIRIFGIFSGLQVYVQLKIFKSNSFSLSGFSHPIYYRPNTVDVSTFREIFIRQEYAINLPTTFTPAYIIDAGANIGFTSLYFHKRFPTAKIFSLEPDGDNFNVLQKNTKPYASITPIQKALWNKEGSIEIVDKGYGLRGFTVEDSTGTNISLPATTISALMAEYQIPHIDILKMDIEGSEKEVFEADTRWLAITKCLIIELHDRMKPGCSKVVFKAIAPYNFEFSVRGENLVFLNKDLV